MALQASITEPKTGVAAVTCYVRISNISINLKDSRVTIDLDFYWSAQASQSGKSPIFTATHEVPKETVAGAFRNNLLTQAYNYLKASYPGLIGAQDV